MTYRLNDVFDWIHRMESEMSLAVGDAGEDSSASSEMHDGTAQCFDDAFMRSLLYDSEATETFKTKLSQAIDGMPPEKQQWFNDSGRTFKMLCDIFERYHTDFSMKVAMGEARYDAGERNVRNSGYKAGSALVSETTQEAYELLYDTVCWFDEKRAVTLLGVTISCALASMGKLTPDHEDLICPQIMKVDPQVSFMPKDQRTPAHIVSRIEAVSAESWAAFSDEIAERSHQDLLDDAQGMSSGYTVI